MQVSDIEFHTPVGKNGNCVITFECNGYQDHPWPNENNLMWWGNSLFYLTGKKNSRYKIKPNQLMNYGIALSQKFMNYKTNWF